MEVAADVGVREFGAQEEGGGVEGAGGDYDAGGAEGKGGARRQVGACYASCMGLGGVEQEGVGEE